ncbi:MAG: MATE family efflux transporter [Kofleriaceae bacterium]|nr:MATE family efflux transporter [Kofleriaceae bacterium]
MNLNQAAATIALPATGWRAHTALAVPLATQQVGLQLMGAVDVAMLGHYSADALAGAGVANALIFTITCVGMGVMMGMESIAPKAIGEGDPMTAHRSLFGAARLALWVGLGCMIAVIASPQLLALTHVDEGVAREARVFVYARAIGVVPFLLSVALRCYLAAFGRTRALLVATVAGNLVNVLLDYFLIYGIDSLGLPPLGVLGAAIATSSVQIVTLLVYVGAARKLLATATARVLATTADVRAIAAFGIPIGGQMLAEVGVFALAGVLAANISGVAAGAHNVAITLASFSFSLAIGIGAATSTQVGYAFGAGNSHGVRRAGHIGLTLGGVVMALCALVFVIMPEPLVALFTNDTVVRAATIPLLRIAAIFQLSDGAQAIVGGALRGLGDTRATLIANLIGHYGVGLGVALTLAFGFDLGVAGLWWGLSAGLTVTAIALYVRFVKTTHRLRSPG